MEDKRYDVVLSFAGEDRSYVKEVARFLESKAVSYFYDEDFEVELWGTNLMEEFDRIYRRDSRYAVLFVSEHYERKMWPRHERRSALTRALEEKREYVLPARFDDTEIDGLLPTTSYLDLRQLSPTEFAVKTCQKIGKDISGSKLNDLPPPHSVYTSGEIAFDYSNHDGLYSIGSDATLFETKWSKASNTAIYCLNDPPSISGVAIAPKGAGLKDLEDASLLDYTSRSRKPEIGRIVVLRNTYGFYAAIKILSIKDDTRGDDYDELRFRYWILNDDSGDFSNLS